LLVESILGIKITSVKNIGQFLFKENALSFLWCGVSVLHCNLDNSLFQTFHPKFITNVRSVFLEIKTKLYIYIYIHVYIHIHIHRGSSVSVVDMLLTGVLEELG
jgi:hypothetical protein